MKKRALLSVWDKSGIVELAKFLAASDFDIISTGGTAKLLREEKISITEIADFTGFPEMLNGRVKTLHPNVHGGILAQREDSGQMEEVSKLDIQLIDVVVVNLYPFANATKADPENLGNALDNIDIGGVTLLRAAAKNFNDVIVLSRPTDYPRFIKEWSTGITESWRISLAIKAFQHTAAYDATIASFLKNNQPYNENLDLFPQELSLTYRKLSQLRYGENPHQKAAIYADINSREEALVNSEQLNGKELSFNNYNDMEAAVALLKEFDQPTAVAVKHKNPCAVASADDIEKAYLKAYAADPVSIYGGIVALNREVDESTALELKKIFLEVVIAPRFSKEAMQILSKKKNLRLIQQPGLLEIDVRPGLQIAKINGGLLVQEDNVDLLDTNQLKNVTDKKPEEEEIRDLVFAWKVVKHVRSNGIVIAKDLSTAGIGPGQTSRIWALDAAIEHSKIDLSGAVLASDAYFPFSDSIEAAYKAGITAVIQPGGSIRDQESIDACNKFKISMLFTGIRHFKH